MVAMMKDIKMGDVRDFRNFMGAVIDEKAWRGHKEAIEEARTALVQFRDRVAAVRENPDQVAAEARTFLAQYADRAQQQALKAAAAVQEGATVSAWVTFGVLVLTLVVAMLGALAGIPSLRTWRMRWTHTGAA